MLTHSNACEEETNLLSDWDIDEESGEAGHPWYRLHRAPPASRRQWYHRSLSYRSEGKGDGASPRGRSLSRPSAPAESSQFILFYYIPGATAFTKDSILSVPAALDGAPRPHLANTRIVN